MTFCGISHPLLPADIMHYSQVLYYIMHGVPDLYKFPYKHTDLKHIFESIARMKNLKKACIYFNNDIDGSAVRNAKELLALTSHTCLLLRTNMGYDITFKY